MKYAIRSELVVSIPAQQDNLHVGIVASIKPETVWGEPIIKKGQSEDKKPGHQALVRFHRKADGDNLFDYIKARMVLIPVVKGKVTKHLCYHDEGGKPCEIIEEFEK